MLNVLACSPAGNSPEAMQGTTGAGTSMGLESTSIDEGRGSTSSGPSPGSSTSAADEGSTIAPGSEDSGRSEESGVSSSSSSTGEPDEVEVSYALDLASSRPWSRGQALAMDSQENTIVLESGTHSGVFPYEDIGFRLTKNAADGSEAWVVEHPCARISAWYSFVFDHVAAGPTDGLVAVGHYDGACSVGQHILPTADDRAFYVASFDSNGVPLWAQGFGGAGEEIGAIALDSEGNVLLAGDFPDVLQIGSEVLVAEQGDDNFIAKLSSDTGEVLWTRHLRSSQTQWSWMRSIALDEAGNVYALGRLHGSLEIGDENVPDENVWELLVSYDADGEYRYHHAAQIDGFWPSSHPNAVVVSPAGEAVVFSFVGEDNALVVGDTTYEATGTDGNVMMTLFDAGGTPQSVTTVSMNHYAYDESRAVVNAHLLPETGEILLFGQYQKAVSFGSDTLPAATDVGWKDGMYAALIRMDGTTAWAWGRGDADNDLYILPGASHDGSSFALQGRFGQELDLGSGLLKDTTEGNFSNMFRARFVRTER